MSTVFAVPSVYVRSHDESRPPKSVLSTGKLRKYWKIAEGRAHHT